jgi:hypothetical protein
MRACYRLKHSAPRIRPTPPSAAPPCALMRKMLRARSTRAPGQVCSGVIDTDGTRATARGQLEHLRPDHRQNAATLRYAVLVQLVAAVVERVNGLAVPLIRLGVSDADAAESGRGRPCRTGAKECAYRSRSSRALPASFRLAHDSAHVPRNRRVVHLVEQHLEYRIPQAAVRLCGADHSCRMP